MMKEITRKASKKELLGMLDKDEELLSALQEIKAFAEWVKDNQFDNGKLLDMWLKEQELCVK